MRRGLLSSLQLMHVLIISAAEGMHTQPLLPVPASLSSRPLNSVGYLKFRNDNATEGILTCRGFMITRRLMMTAAHCLDGRVGWSLQANRFWLGNTFRVIKKYFVVTDSQRHAKDVDNIAIAYFDTSFNQEVHWRLPMPGEDEKFVDWETSDDEVTVIGLDPRHKDKEPVTSHQIYLNTMTCARTFTLSIEDYKKILCAFYYRKPKYFMCKYDSGAPLFHRSQDGEDVVFGIASHSFHYCDENGKLYDQHAASVFMRLTSYMPILLNIIEMRFTEERDQLKDIYKAWHHLIPRPRMKRPNSVTRVRPKKILNSSPIHTADI